MMRSSFLVLLFVLTPVVLYGQLERQANAGSAYSSIAFGQPADLLSPAAAGMGLSGVAIYNPFAANSANPALWGISSYTQGVLSFGLQNVEASDGLESAEFNQFSVDQFHLVFPVVRSRLGISARFTPVTRANYDLSNEGSITPEGETVRFLNRVKGTGGINDFEMGLGYRISGNFAIGYAATLHFARFNREFDTIFDTASFARLNFEESITGTSFGHRFGFYARKSELLRGNDEVSFGAALGLPSRISSDRNLSSFRQLRGQMRTVDLLSDTDVSSGDIELPLEINLGLTYNPSRLFNISVEYLNQHWSEARFSFRPDQEQLLTDRTKIGVGTQFHPYRGEGAGFFSNFRYSAGATYDTGHLMIEGENIETVLFHAGIGILSERTRSSVDMSFQFGFRGTEQQNLIKENIWGIKFSLNLAEIMFLQPRFQ